MKTRSDKYFIGGENIDYKTQGAELFSEQLILIFVSLLCVVFFLIYPNFLQKSLVLGKVKYIFSLILFLVLSPFGAHLITVILSGIWGCREYKSHPLRKSQ